MIDKILGKHVFVFDVYNNGYDVDPEKRRNSGEYLVLTTTFIDNGDPIPITKQ